MAVETEIGKGVLIIGSQKTLTVDVKQADGVTPQAQTGWSTELVFRRDDGQVVITKTTPGITFSNGVGTDDRATIALAAADSIDVREGWHFWGYWRTDGANDVLLAYGPAYWTKAAAQ